MCTMNLTLAGKRGKEVWVGECRGLQVGVSEREVGNIQAILLH